MMRSSGVRLGDLLDVSVLQRLAEANHKATGMPIGIVDALDGAVLVGCGWQEICVRFHHADARAVERCRESDAFIHGRVAAGEACEYRCRNGLRDIGVPIVVCGEHLATLFLGQFFYEGEAPDRAHFVQQARELGFDEGAYLAALERVPKFARASVENIVAYDKALVAFIADFAESTLRRARDQEALRDADRRKDEFLSVLSHELRNPLAPIRTSIHVLNHASPDAARAERARLVIERQSEHLARLVDDLLDVTRIARGKISLRREPVDVAASAALTAEDLRDEVTARGLELAVELPPERVIVEGDPTRLAQVVGNLLQNAAKFTPTGGRVTLSVRAERGAAELRVRDTGIGIAPDLLARVFDPFVQADRSLARTEAGLGLGLALVKGIAELHGGSVHAASAGLGAGAEFTVRLPLAAGASPSRREDDGAAPHLASRLVLVVDDNMDAADSLADLVRMFGHRTEVAYDGPSALEKARATRPDVVLCDLGLPGLSGYDVARALRTEHPGMRLVAASGYAQPEDVARALEAGFEAHLPKPPDPDAIERLLALPA